MEYSLRTSSQFDKDIKLAKRRGLDLDALYSVVDKLMHGETLSPEYRDHALSGNFKGCRDCHISPDWLLIYRRQQTLQILQLVRTGTHSDLF